MCRKNINMIPQIVGEGSSTGSPCTTLLVFVCWLCRELLVILWWFLEASQTQADWKTLVISFGSNCFADLSGDCQVDWSGAADSCWSSARGLDR